MWASDGRVAQQRLEQDRDQIGYVGEVSGTGTGPSRVGQQRQCQRVAAAQLQQPLPVRLGDAGPGQQVARCRPRRGGRGDGPRPPAASPGRCATAAAGARGRRAPRRRRRPGTAGSRGAASRRSAPSCSYPSTSSTVPLCPPSARAPWAAERRRRPGPPGEARPATDRSRARPAAPWSARRREPGRASRAAAWSCRCRPGRARTALAAASAPASASSKARSSDAGRRSLPPRAVDDVT